MWQFLLSNLALVTGVAVLWSFALDWIGPRPLVRSVCFGALMGLGAITSMTFAYEFVPGFVIDLRSALLAAAGFFGGPVVGILAASLAVFYRMEIGGAGALGGCIGILVATLIGVVGYRLRQNREPGHRDIFLLSLAIAGSGAVMSLVLPMPIAPEFILAAALPNMVAKFVATLMVSAIILAEERRRSLIRTNLMYRKVVESLPDPLNIKDRDGKFLLANSATAALMKAESAADLIGKSDFDFYPREVAEGFRNDEVWSLDGGPTKSMDQLVVYPDNSSKWVWTLKAPLRDEEGQILGIITHNRDITERKNLEIKIRTMQKHLDDALESMTDALVLYDADGRLVFSNPRYNEMFPKTADLHVPGVKLSEIIRASVDRGEEVAPAEVDIDRWCEARAAEQMLSGEHLIEMADGKTFEARSRKVSSGGTLIVIADVTHRRNVERELTRKAMHDPLTGLPNRERFAQRLNEAYAEAQSSESELTIMLIDLDRFKNVNDTFGHAAGDKFLVEIARRLKSAVRQHDMVARLGGDEFAIIAEGQGMQQATAFLVRRIFHTLKKPVALENVSVMAGCSIGYAVYPTDHSSPDNLMAHADLALYQARARGRGCAQEYRPEVNAVERAG